VGLDLLLRTLHTGAETSPSRTGIYCALPLLWRDRVIGWANLAVKNGALLADFGYVQGQRPTDRAFARELEAELSRMQFSTQMLNSLLANAFAVEI
jgi:uncharacterized protein YcaQ